MVYLLRLMSLICYLPDALVECIGQVNGSASAYGDSEECSELCDGCFTIVRTRLQQSAGKRTDHAILCYLPQTVATQFRHINDPGGIYCHRPRTGKLCRETGPIIIAV